MKRLNIISMYIIFVYSLLYDKRYGGGLTLKTFS